MEPRSEPSLATDYLFGTNAAQNAHAAPRIPGVRLDRTLGEGAFGVVWQGEQLEPVQRVVAVKVLRTAALNSHSLRRFEAEKLSLARLEHPHIAHILDAGTTADGAPYLVMEYIDGVAFDAWCERHRDNLAERIRMFGLICRAISYAHRQGILHRDLKPANVLVRNPRARPIDTGAFEPLTAQANAQDARAAPSSREGSLRSDATHTERLVEEPKIIDFGVAKLVGFDAQSTATLQHPAAATPMYMSPEIATGQSDIDGRVDVWSLGVMLFEAVVGKRPFHSERSGMAAAVEIQQQITSLPIPRASDLLGEHAPRALKSAVEDDLDWIIMRAMARNPAERYLTPDALADDLDRWLAGAPVLARPSSALYRFRKYARRNRAVLALCGVVVATGGIALGTVVASSLQRAKEVARWKEIAAFNERMLTAIDPAVAQGLDPTLMRLVLGEAEAELTRKERDPTVEAEIRSSLGNAYAATGLTTRALEQYDRVRAIRVEQGDSRDSAQQRSISNATGRVLVEAGRLAEAEPLLLEASDANDLIAAQALHNLATLALARGEHSRAEELLRASIRAKRSLGAPELSALDGEQELARVYASAGRVRDALPIARGVLAAKLSLLGARHPDSLRASNNLAEVLLALAVIDEARALLESAVVTFAEVLGSTHPDTLAARNNLAGALRESGALDEAARLYADNRADFLRARGEADPRAILAAANLAHCLALLNRSQEAETTFRETQAVALRVLGPTHRFTLANDANYASFLIDHDRTAEAVVLLERTVPLIERALTADHPQSLAARVTLASGRLRMGDAAAALTALGDVENYAASHEANSLVRRALELAEKAATASGDTERAARLRTALAKPSTLAKPSIE